MRRHEQMAGLRRSAPLRLQRWTDQRINRLFASGHALFRELLTMEQDEIKLERLIQNWISEPTKKISSAREST
jgi:hypothetical protein